MTDEQNKFLVEMIEQFSDETFEKFSIGVVEHGGGNIWEIPILQLVKEAKAEMNDGRVYLHVIEKLLTIILQDPLIKMRVQEIMKLEKLIAARKAK